MLDRMFMDDMAMKVRKRYVEHIFLKGKDVFGKKFKGYSEKYKESKRSGRMFRQATEFKDSTAPILTSDLLRDWKLQGTSATGFSFGTATQGGKIANLAKLGRIISTDSNPLPKKIEKFIMNQATKYVKKRLGKIKGRTINI